MKGPEQQNGSFEPAAMRPLIDLRLKARLRDQAGAEAVVAHPDEDILNAFVEGTLDDSESLSLTSHLVSCPSCLHLTAQLIRFEPEEDEVGSASIAGDEPGPLERFFDRLGSGGIPSIDEEAVFAYEAKDEPAGDKAESDADSPEPTDKSK